MMKVNFSVDINDTEELKSVIKTLLEILEINRKYPSVEEMNLTVRALNSLKNYGIKSSRDLVKLRFEDPLAVPNLGRKCINEIESSLKDFDLKLSGR